jgi:hypothetical protein
MEKTAKAKVFWVKDYTRNSDANASEKSKALLFRSALKAFPNVTACTIEKLGFSGKYADRYVFWRHDPGHWSSREQIFSLEKNNIDGVLILSEVSNQSSESLASLSKRVAKIFRDLSVLKLRPGGFLSEL